MTLIDAVSRLVPGFWVIRPVPSRTPSRMACWIIPTILGRRCWMG